MYNSGDYTAIFDTEANWQSAVTTYGVCGKFVYDSVNSTVRLPKYSNKIYTKDLASTAGVKGNGKSIGLTTGTVDTSMVQQGSYGYYMSTPEGVGVTLPSTAGANTSATGGTLYGLSTDSTKSGIIADLANITTPLDGYYYIVIATTTKTDIQVDIDEIATDLNGKVDKADLAEIQCVIETYQNGSSWYRVYSDGWCEQGGYLAVVASEGASQTINFLKAFSNNNYYFSRSCYLTNTTGTYTGSFTGFSTKTSISITFTSSLYSGNGTYWYACGYIS